MNPARSSWAIGAWAAAAVVAAAEAPDISRFKVILERQPFGAPTAAAPTPTAPAAESALANFRLSAIVEASDGGYRAGIVDQRTQRSYFLGPGQSEEGLEVVSIAFEDESAQVRLNGETAILRLQGATAAGAAVRSGAPNRLSPPGAPPGISGVTPRGSGPPWMRRRLGAPEGGEAAPPSAEGAGAPPPPPRPSPEEVERRLRDYQMEVIRRGLPPLPIPLTPEMDAQLVREGVLPPQ